MPEMTLEEITAIIFKAYTHNTEIRIQERRKSKDGFNSSIVIGKVKGFDDSAICVGNNGFALDDILWCELIE